MSIEITSEMVEAGVDSLRGRDLDQPTENEQRAMVARVFRAMVQAQREYRARAPRL